MMADSVFGDDLGGVGKQVTGAPIPNIGETSGTAVAPAERDAPLVDGYPVSPYLAARRYGAAAGQNQPTGNPDAGAP